MSRGLGRVERKLMDRVGRGQDDLRPELWLALDRLLELGSASRSRQVSVRRAATSLAANGLIEKTHYFAAATARAPGYYLLGATGAGVRRCVAVRAALTREQLDDVADLAWRYEQQLERLVASQEHGDEAGFQNAVRWLEWYELPTRSREVVTPVYV